MANSGAMSASGGRNWPSLTRIRPMLGELCHFWRDFGRCVCDGALSIGWGSALGGPTSAKFGPMSATVQKCSTHLGRCRGSLAQSRPNLVGLFGPMWTKVAPVSASANLGRIPSDLPLVWTSLGNFDQMWAKFDPDWPSSAKFRRNPVKSGSMHTFRPVLGKFGLVSTNFRPRSAGRGRTGTIVGQQSVQDVDCEHRSAGQSLEEGGSGLGVGAGSGRGAQHRLRDQRRRRNNTGGACRRKIS